MLRQLAHRLLVRVAPRRVAEGFWRSRPAEDARYYADSTALPYRRPLVEQLLRLRGESFLELGASAGPNLRLLAEAAPDARLAGIDLSPEAVELGRSLGLDLRLGSLQALLPTLPRDGFDVVFSCGALVCLPPRDLRLVLAEVRRVARLALVLLEPLPDAKHEPGRLPGATFWRHDYAAELARLGVPPDRIARYRLPADGADVRGPLNGWIVASV